MLQLFAWPEIHTKRNLSFSIQCDFFSFTICSCACSEDSKEFLWWLIRQVSENELLHSFAKCLCIGISTGASFHVISNIGIQASNVDVREELNDTVEKRVRRE